MRSIASWLLATIIAAVALSACSSSSPPAGVLTRSDIPSYLGVKADQSASAAEARSVRTTPCKLASGVVFDSKRATVTNVSLSCASVSQAQEYFNTIKVGAKGYPLPGVVGHSLTGVGDEAWLVDAGGKADLREYTLGWRQNEQVGLVTVEGPLANGRITPALAGLLARRVAARS